MATITAVLRNLGYPRRNGSLPKGRAWRVQRICLRGALSYFGQDAPHGARFEVERLQRLVFWRERWYFLILPTEQGDHHEPTARLWGAAAKEIRGLALARSPERGGVAR